VKPVILNIRELSDSKELYDSKPNSICNLLIYFILILLVVAGIWAYFGKIDIVVKSEAVIRPNEQVSTVVNNYEGKLQQVCVEDGQEVKKGDILYTVDCAVEKGEKEFVEKNLEKTNSHIDLLKKLKSSIMKNRNYFDIDKKEEEPYYIQFENYYLEYEMLKYNATYTEDEVSTNIELVQTQLSEAEQKKNMSQRLRDAIEKGKNTFTRSGVNAHYYNLYEKYDSDYKQIVLQYQAKEREITASSSKEGAVNAISYLKTQKEGHKTLRLSIENKISMFSSESSYSLKYKEFEGKTEQLQNTYQEAKDLYELNLELKDYGITEHELKQSKNAMDEAEKAIETYRANYLAEVMTTISDLDKQINDLKRQKNNNLSKESLIKCNEQEEKAALKNYVLQYKTELENQVVTLNESVLDLQGTLKSDLLQQKKDYWYTDEEGNRYNGSAQKYKLNALLNTVDSIEEKTNTKKEQELNINKLEESIDNALVEAQIDGVVNTTMDLVEGDLLSAGSKVLTIIPTGENLYKASIYVSNQDIGKLKKDMQVKCNVYALPNKEYGYLTGKLISISEDVKVSDKNTGGYYLVEADLDKTALYDAKGKKANIKTGMGCQAQIITDQKRILTYLFETLDLCN